MRMKEYIIQKLNKEEWKGMLLPVDYTSQYYYDIRIEKTEGGNN